MSIRSVTARFRLPCLAGLLLCIVGCKDSSDSGAPSPQTWRFAIEEVQGSIQDQYAQRFKELIEERSDGAITVTVYPYGTLGTSDEITEQLRAGTVQFAMASPGHLGTLIPEVQVFLLHFLLSEDEAVNKAVLADDAVLTRFDELYAQKDLKLLGFIQEGWMVWTTQQPIRSPGDFDGLKMRVMTSPLLLAAYEAYGASPVAMPYSEVYSGLQLKMIDGQVNPVFAIEEMSFYEVSKWMIFPNHAPFIASVVSNDEFYRGLPAETQAMLDEVIAEVDDFIFEVQRTVNRERLNTIRERKPDINVIDELTAEEREAFRAASLGVRDQFIEMAGGSGEEILQLITEAVQKYEGE